MASGHASRINRPNTWLFRPELRREESPCQHGAVHTWHYPAIAHWSCGRFALKPTVPATENLPRAWIRWQCRARCHRAKLRIGGGSSL